jgi:predicted nucleotidyltransferase
VSTRSSRLDEICRAHHLVAVYLFGSRATDGLGLLEGAAPERRGSDLDVGVVFADGVEVGRLPALQIALEDVFEPMQVDLVPLQRVDALFQYAAIEGHRIAVTDATRADLFELYVMRRAAEALPVERERERAIFGVTST